MAGNIHVMPVFAHKEVPADIYSFYLSMLMNAIDIHLDPSQADTVEKGQAIVVKLMNELNRLCKKHLSDSPNETDRLRLHADVFAFALIVARG